MKLFFLLSALVFCVIADFSGFPYHRPLHNLNYDPYYDNSNWEWDESKKQLGGEYEIPSENGLWKGIWETRREVRSTTEKSSEQSSKNTPNDSEHPIWSEPKNSADFNDLSENAGSEVVMRLVPEQYPLNNPNHISEHEKSIEPTTYAESWIAERMEDWLGGMKAGEAEVDERIGQCWDEFREGEVEEVGRRGGVFYWIVKMKIDERKRSAEYYDSEEDDESLIDEFIEEFLRKWGEALQKINMGNELYDYNELRDFMNPDHTGTKGQFGRAMDEILRLSDKIKAGKADSVRRNKRGVFVIHNIGGKDQCIEAVRETLKQLREQPQVPIPPNAPSDEIM